MKKTKQHQVECLHEEVRSLNNLVRVIRTCTV